MDNNQTRRRHGSATFYNLLGLAAEIHDKKSHDYANNDQPYGNYHFAGEFSKLFNNPHDAGFAGRLAEKLYRLANLENGNKKPRNESIEDTEMDLVVIMALWMSSRIDRRIASSYDAGPTEKTLSESSLGHIKLEAPDQQARIACAFCCRPMKEQTIKTAQGLFYCSFFCLKKSMDRGNEHGYDIIVPYFPPGGEMKV